LGVVIAGANVVEQKLLKETIEAIVIERPDPDEVEQNLNLDKGYDNPRSREAAAEGGYVPHIRRIGEEKKPCARTKGHKPRRWVVERGAPRGAMME
jgi:putative transposase